MQIQDTLLAACQIAQEISFEIENFMKWQVVKAAEKKQASIFGGCLQEYT